MERHIDEWYKSSLPLIFMTRSAKTGCLPFLKNLSHVTVGHLEGVLHGSPKEAETERDLHKVQQRLLTIINDCA